MPGWLLDGWMPGCLIMLILLSDVLSWHFITFHTIIAVRPRQFQASFGKRTRGTVHLISYYSLLLQDTSVCLVQLPTMLFLCQFPPIISN